MLVVILAVLAIAAPVMATDGLVGCGSPTPTPTPTATPTPVPTQPFSCAAGERSLVADGEVVGCVAITNDNTYLYVNFSSSPSYQMKMANWTEGNIPVDSTSIPVLGKFLYSYVFKDGETYHLFPRVNISETVGSDVDFSLFSAHAVVEKKSVQTCTWIASDGTETFTAYNNSALGPDLTGVPSYPKAPLRSGKAVLAYISPWHNPSLYFGTSSNPFTFTIGKWIWESYFVKDPYKGDVVDFTKTFTLGGVPASGTLWITADDGYNVSLNGVPVGSEGLNNGWRTSNLKYAYVPGHGLWKSVEKYNLTKTLKEGTNTFYIQTANRYMGCDNYLPPGVTATDSDGPTSDSGSAITFSSGSLVTCGGSCVEPKGTTQTNIGALIFEARICTAASSTKDAWVLDTNGAKFFQYPVDRVQFTFSPSNPTLELPGQTIQPITVTAKGRSGPVRSAPLVFTTDFGLLTGENKVVTVTSNSNGMATIDISSSTPVTANLTIWIDSNKNGIQDPWEWTSLTSVEWLAATTLTLDPQTASVQLPETDQVLTAAVLDQDGNPMYTIPVIFKATSGSIAETNPVSANEDGLEMVTISSPTPAAATVTAFIDANGDAVLDHGEMFNTSAVTWLRQKAASISLEPSPEATVTLPQTDQVLTVTVLGQGSMPLSGVPVDFNINFNSGRSQQMTVDTDANGLAKITVTSPTADIATITASADGFTAASAVTWLRQKAASISLEPSPEATVTLPQTDQVLTVTVLGQGSMPLSGVPVDFTINFNSGRSQQTTIDTDANGLAKVTVTSSEVDTAAITARADGFTATSTVTWTAAQTSPTP